MSLCYGIKRRRLSKRVVERNHKMAKWLLENADKLSLNDILELCNRCNRIYKWYLKRYGKRIQK